jgi:hypothetical protein
MCCYIDYKGYRVWRDKICECWRAKIDGYTEAIFQSRDKAEKYIDELIERNAKKDENDD